MNISKKSWHYRFIKFMDIPQPPPKNLCAYVGLLVLLSFVVLVFALLTPYLGTIFGNGLGHCYYIGFREVYRMEVK